MLFNVSGLMLEGIGETRFHQVDGTLHTQGRPPEHLTGTVEMLRTRDGILVRASFDLVDPETCSRCLAPLEETIHIGFEEEFRATVDPRSGRPAFEDPSGDAFTIDEDNMLDLTEAVRQYREASADMQPLCRPDCRGLCPVCGQDLNAGDCGCAGDRIDSRWAGLAALRGAEIEGRE